MKASISKTALLGAVLAIGTLAITPAAMAKGHGKDRMYEVTITNATLGQPIAPSVIATHSDDFELFELGPVPMIGDPGYDYYFALATMAETGSPDLARDEVAASYGVWEAVALPPILFPRESNSTLISASGKARYLSAMAMLGKTNDAFYAVRDVPLPKHMGETVRVLANAYDAGSEANAESAATVGALGSTEDDPMTGMGINENGEGYIHVHAGIHGVGGVGGLDPVMLDWRGPVVEVTIERVD